jgi:glucose/arabinose dehydrogenase
MAGELILKRILLAALVGAVLAPTSSFGLQTGANITIGTVGVQVNLVKTVPGGANADLLYGTSAPGDSNLFIVQKGKNGINNGRILYFNPAIANDPVKTLIDFNLLLPGFLDSGHDEKGLLGVAFHPNFATVGAPGYLKFYTYSNENYSAHGTVDYIHAETATNPTTLVNNVDTLREWTADSVHPTSATPSRVILRVADPQNQHNGGTVAFSPVDGYLYWGLGDGGGNSSNSPDFSGSINSATDGHTNNVTVSPGVILPHGNGQDRTNPLGDVIRINPLSATTNPDTNANPSTNGQYQIPKDNPFTMESNINPSTMAPYTDWNSAWVDEIYAYGVRNPYRFSFDRGASPTDPNRGKLYLADAGYNDREEVDLIEKGKNYGWVIREGTDVMEGQQGIPHYTAPVNAQTGLPDTLTEPVAEHNDDISNAIIGGFVSRQSSTNGLFGKYVFGGYQSLLNSNDAILLYFDTNEVKSPESPYTIRRLAATGASLSDPLLGMGEGPNGTLYAFTDFGNIFELVAKAIALPGDYDNNQVVDVADYIVWRDNFGTNTILLNDAVGGMIGDGQYIQWKANFGKTIATGGTGTSVPEPAFEILLTMAGLAGVLAAPLRRRRHSSRGEPAGLSRRG